MKTRLLFVCDSLCLGGAERVLVDILTGLDYTRFDVHVWMLQDINAFHSQTQGLPVEIHSVGLIHPTPRSFHDLKALRLIWNDIRFFEPHVIHTQGQDADLIGQIMGFFSGSPRIVTTLHLPDVLRVQPSVASVQYRIRLLMENVSIHACTTVIAISGAMRGYIISQRHVVSERILLLRNAVQRDTSIHTVGRERGMMIGFVGRLALQKNLHTAIDAFCRVHERCPEARLTIVGNGPLEKNLRAYAATRGISDYVFFTGARDDIQALLRTFDVLILPSFTEGLPLVLLEAMESGVPIVASAVGGIPEIIKDGVTGVLIPSPDQELFARYVSGHHHVPPVDFQQSISLSQAIENLLTDPARGGSIADAARRYVRQEHSLERNIEILQHLYESFALRRPSTVKEFH